MSTGHCSTHAPHVVHDHSTSSSITAPPSGVPYGLYAVSGLVMSYPVGPTSCSTSTAALVCSVIVASPP
jgi:hypothetical protein